MDPAWLKIENLFVNIYGKEILCDITLEIKRGEQWIICGQVGSGKTVFADTLSGNHAFQGLISFPGLKEAVNGKLVNVVAQQHRFRDLQNQSNFYYQQRYNALDADTTISVAEAISFFEEEPPGYFSKSKLLKTFHLVSVLHKPLIQLSNGENKRLQILKAVLSFPGFLILDEPFTGLDEESRGLLDEILSRLTQSGQQILLLTSRFHFPSCFTRYAKLESGRLQVLNKKPDIHSLQGASTSALTKDFPSGLDFYYSDFRYAVRMLNVDVQYGGKKILDGINWEIEKGACWALTGQNGAGKSTLLSLITADHPQAYANDIFLFDRKRGSGESIWEIKQKIGYLSPELQLYFDPIATVFSAVASGLFDTIGLFRTLNTEQEKYVWQWLEYLDVTNFASRLLVSLPAGLQRMILLGRAMIKRPPLLILDEPCQGLDSEQTAFTISLIDQYCSRFVAGLIFVSHYKEDFPACIRQTLHLDNGKMA
jgi:molybdate transport system ATP-binding protein